MTWIEWFCSLPGNEGVCIIPQSFICMVCPLSTDVSRRSVQFIGSSAIHRQLRGCARCADGEDSEQETIRKCERIDDKKIDKIATSVIELYSILHQRFIASDEGLECIVPLRLIDFIARRASTMITHMVCVLATTVTSALSFR